MAFSFSCRIPALPVSPPEEAEICEIPWLRPAVKRTCAMPEPSVLTVAGRVPSPRDTPSATGTPVTGYPNSSKVAGGYLGDRPGYRVELVVDRVGTDLEREYLGTNFQTALEGAVAYARRATELWGPRDDANGAVETVTELFLGDQLVAVVLYCSPPMRWQPTQTLHILREACNMCM